MPWLIGLLQEIEGSLHRSLPSVARLNPCPSFDEFSAGYLAGPSRGGVETQNCPAAQLLTLRVVARIPYCRSLPADCFSSFGIWGERYGKTSTQQDQRSAFPSLYDAVFSSFSARSQSCSGEPSGQPRSAQYFSARRAISSREGAGGGVCFFAAGFRFLGAPFAASPLLVVIPISLINSH
jgi:hypothetical protein